MEGLKNNIVLMLNIFCIYVSFEACQSFLWKEPSMTRGHTEIQFCIQNVLSWKFLCVTTLYISFKTLWTIELPDKKSLEHFSSSLQDNLWSWKYRLRLKSVEQMEAWVACNEHQASQGIGRIWKRNSWEIL